MPLSVFYLFYVLPALFVATTLFFGVALPDIRKDLIAKMEGSSSRRFTLLSLLMMTFVTLCPVINWIGVAHIVFKALCNFLEWAGEMPVIR